MHRLLIKNGTLVTLGEPNQILAQDLAIAGQHIETLAQRGSLNDADFDEVFDAQGLLVMPGFINNHMHFYSSFATGLATMEPAHNFSQILENLWWRLDKQLTLADCYHSALVACISAIRHGTTTIIDHHASPGAIRGSLHEVARAVLASGLRASLCYELSDRDGPKAAQAGIEENMAFLEEVRYRKDHHLHGLFGLHASFTLSPKTLATAVERAGDEGFHIHVAEDRYDQDSCRKETGQRVVQRLAQAGVLGDKTVCAHCVHIDEAEADLLAETNTIVTYQPQSNMNNGVGIMDLVKLTRRGITVGLGTDAMTLNMLEELRTAVWAQKLRAADPSVGFGESVQCLIGNNPAIANRFFKAGVGELREGFLADLAIVDYRPHTPLGADNFAGHLVFGISQARVHSTIASGKILMNNGALTCLDEEKIFAEAQRHAKALWQRL